MIVVLGNTKLLVAVELTDSTQVHITTQDGDTNALLGGKLLQFLNEPITLCFVMFRSPVVIEIIQDFNATIELVDESAQSASATKCFDRIHDPASKKILQEVQSWISDGNTQQDKQVLCFALYDLGPAAIEDHVVAFLAQDLVTHPFRSAIQTQERRFAAQEHEDASAELVNVRTRACSKKPTRFLLRGLGHKRLVLK